MEKSKNAHNQESSWTVPVVTVMGHVDSGKTTLLDTLRQTHVASAESGGITQHVSFYSLEFQGKRITFLDTPGHEAFTSIRSRGGRVADIVILVVDAVAGVQPQTLEAISHAQGFGVTIIVAINKVDLPSANPALVKNQLATAGLLLEGFGGVIVCVEISAKTGQNIDNLMEMVVLASQLNPPPGNPLSPLKAFIVESRLDRRRGPVATVVVKSGRLAVRDRVWAGSESFRVRQILDERGKGVTSLSVGEAGEVLGFSKVPPVGVEVRADLPVKEESQPSAVPTALSLPRSKKALRIIIKADVTGSLEALKLALSRIPLLGEKLSIVFAALGDVSDSDVSLAKATSALILTFRVKADQPTARLGESLGVEIRHYQIIYKLIEDIEEALKGMAAWQKSEGVGQATVLKVFPLHSGDRVYGCSVTQGVLNLGDTVRILRGETELGKNKVKSLRVAKDKVGQVSAGKECGILLSGDIAGQVGDQLEVF